MQYYFCYSSALDLDSLNQWKTQHGYADFSLPPGQKARALHQKLVADFPSRFWGGRVIGLESNFDESVMGIVFEIKNPADWSIIRHKEGVMTGASIEIEVEIDLNGTVQKALAYSTHPAKRAVEGPLSQNFFAALGRAYETWGINTDALKAVQ